MFPTVKNLRYSFFLVSKVLVLLITCNLQTYDSFIHVHLRTFSDIGVALGMDQLAKNLNVRGFCFQYHYKNIENSNFQKLCEYYSSVRASFTLSNY